MRESILRFAATLGLAGLLAGCAPTLADIQFEQYRSVRVFADHLFTNGILTKKDRLLVVRLGYPLYLSGDAARNIDPGRDLFFEDSFVSGLLQNGAVVLEKMDVNPPPAQREADNAARSDRDLLLLVNEGQPVAVGKVRDALTGFGLTKVVVYRWVYHAQNLTPGAQGVRNPPVLNRAFVRVLDATSGYLIWSGFLSSPAFEAS